MVSARHGGKIARHGASEGCNRKRRMCRGSGSYLEQYSTVLLELGWWAYSIACMQGTNVRNSGTYQSALDSARDEFAVLPAAAEANEGGAIGWRGGRGRGEGSGCGAMGAFETRGFGMLSARTRDSSGCCSGRASWRQAGGRLERGRGGYIRVCRGGTGNGCSSRVRVGSREAQTSKKCLVAEETPHVTPPKSPAIPSTGCRRHRTRPPRATSDIFFSSLGTASPPHAASDSRSQQAPPDGTPSAWPLPRLCYV
jgi:hypothetical protein